MPRWECVIEDEQKRSSAKDAKNYHWRRQTIAETFERIKQDPEQPWVAIGDFLDDWRFTAPADRLALMQEPIMSVDVAVDDVELRRWAAFCAAMVEWLCWQDGAPFPSWTRSDEYYLAKPWFRYPGDLLRAWQLTSTPTPFKMRNIFGGDQMLTRV
jgi:hypothetical protein